MAARKGTILSDEHILKECAHYRPIPMKLAAKILNEDSVSAMICVSVLVAAMKNVPISVRTSR